MTIKKIFFALTLVILMCQSLEVWAREIIHLPINGGTILQIKNKNFKTVYLSSPDIANIQMQAPGVIYISALKFGSTFLYVTDNSGNIILKRKIIVGVDTAQLSSIIHQIAPSARVRITTLNNNLVLHGHVNSPAVGQKIHELAVRFVGDEKHVIDFLSLSSSAQVYIKVKIVELDREVSRIIGLKSWAILYNSNHANLIGANDSSVSSISDLSNLTSLVPGMGFNINALIEGLDNDTLAKVLSEPNLTALSGQQADFLAGGEFPILVPQSNFGVNTVEFQKFGVSLHFIPTLLDDNTINLQVKTEVSEISNEQSVQIQGNTVPSLTTRNASTTVQVRSGNSFAIAGLLQDELRDSVTRFPGLGNLPVLGPLFSSKEYTQNETELVIIVTPFLVKPVAKGLETPIDGVSSQDLAAKAAAAMPPPPPPVVCCKKYTFITE